MKRAWNLLHAQSSINNAVFSDVDNVHNLATDSDKWPNDNILLTTSNVRIVGKNIYRNIPNSDSFTQLFNRVIKADWPLPSFYLYWGDKGPVRQDSFCSFRALDFKQQNVHKLNVTNIRVSGSNIMKGEVVNELAANEFFKDKGLIAYITDLLIVKTGVIRNIEFSIESKTVKF